MDFWNGLLKSVAEHFIVGFSCDIRDILIFFVGHGFSCECVCVDSTAHCTAMNTFDLTCGLPCFGDQTTDGVLLWLRLVF